ncbi:MAG: class I SAM-dependent methyltransferase [Acidobacteriota bacterium]
MDNRAATVLSNTWSPEGYQRHAGFVSALTDDVLAMLAPKAGERILDLGCGDGTLARRLAAGGAIVVGVDSSPQFVAAASAVGVEAREMNAEALTFDSEFDAVFSNAALHWMLRPAEVIAGVRRALRPGGRFVGEFGGHGNVAAIGVAISAVLKHHDWPVATQWFFPSAAEYQALLERHGFVVQEIGLHARPTILPTGMEGWLETFARPLFHAVPPAARAAALEEILALLRPALRDSEGLWTADYVRLRFDARIPPAA